MPRDVDAAMLAELEGAIIRPRFFLQIELEGGSTVNYWTGEKDITWNSKTWIANGFFKSTDQISESSDHGFEGLSVDLCGEPSALISALLSSIKRNRRVDLYFGLVSDSNVVTNTPVRFTGVIEKSKLIDGINEATIRIECTSDLARLNTSIDRRFNAQSQAIDYPNDTGLRYVEKLQNFNGVWGKQKSNIRDGKKKNNNRNNVSRNNKNKNKKGRR